MYVSVTPQSRHRRAWMHGNTLLRKDFGIWMRERRESKKLTLEEVAERLGTTHTTVQRYETGKRATPFDIVPSWARAIAVPPSSAVTQWIASQSDVEDELNNITFITDPDARSVAEAYDGLPRDIKRVVKGQILSAAEAARQIEKEGFVVGVPSAAALAEDMSRDEAFGARRADHNENPNRENED